MSTFDVMLPYYGDVALMQMAVRSVIAQSDPDWRLTVVDDGTAAGVPEWFASLADDRIRYLRNPTNLGVTGNYNRCLDLVEFDYFTMMGTDDIMAPNYLRVMRTVIEANPGIGMIQPGVEVIDSAGKVIWTLADTVKHRLYEPKTDQCLILSGEPLALSLLKGNWLYFSSICWRTAAVKAIGFRPDLEIIQDLALVIDLVAGGERLALEPTRCFQYRRHAVSISAAQAVKGPRFTEARDYFLDAADQMSARGWPSAAKAARRYTSSRLHALTLVPTAVLAGDGTGVSALARHALGPSRRSA